MTASRRRALLIAGALGLAVVAVLVLRSRGAAAAATVADTSGTPGPDLTGSAAQQPSGGAASVPGNLPASLLSSPDPVQQQVQQTNAGASTVSGGGSGTVVSSSPQQSYGFTTYTAPGGQTFTTDVGGSPANPPTFNPSTGSWFEGALPSYLPLPTAPPAPPSSQSSPYSWGQGGKQ